MGTIIYYPAIRATDYDTFSGVLHASLPDTYDRWLDFQHKEMREIVLAGNNPKEVEVDPDEFARYCQAKRATTRNLDTLRQFAAEKGTGKRY